jgi:hypothetical protein
MPQLRRKDRLMDVRTLIQKVLDLVREARAGNYLVALGLALEIIRDLAQAAPLMHGSHSLASAGAAAEAKDEADLLSELEDCCKAHANEASISPLVVVFMPLVMALLKKLLGF